MRTSQQSPEVVAVAAVADSDVPEVGAAGTGACLFSPSSSLLLLLLLLSTRRQNGCLHAETAGDYSAAVES